MDGKHYVKRCLPKKHNLQLQNTENNLAIQQKNGDIKDGIKQKRKKKTVSRLKMGCGVDYL